MIKEAMLSLLLLRIVVILVGVSLQSVPAAPLAATPFINKATAEPKSVKTDDLKDLITTIETPEKREEFLKNLKALTATRESPTSQKDWIFSFIQMITSKTKALASLLVEVFTSTLSFPLILWKVLDSINDLKCQQMLLWLLVSLGLSLSGGWGSETLIRRLIRKKDYRQFIRLPFKNKKFLRFSHQIVKNLVPSFVFGILSYGIALLFKSFSLAPLSLITFISIVWLIRFSLAVIKTLLEPERTHFRLLSVSQPIAGTLYRGFWVMGQMIIIGSLLSLFFRALNLEDSALAVWTHLVGFAIAVMAVIVILEHKKPITLWVRKEETLIYEKVPAVILNLIRALAGTWHIFAVLFIFAFYSAWALDEMGTLLFLLTSTMLTTLLIGELIYFNRKIAIWRQMGKETHITPEAWQESLHPTLIELVYYSAPSLHILSYLGAFVLLLEIWGIDLFSTLADQTLQPYFMTTISVGFILMVTKLLWVAVNLVVHYQTQPVVINDRTLEPTIFIKTIAPIFNTVAHWVLVVVAMLLILAELGIDIMPFIYGFSVIGIAIGLGSQSLIKDLINGFLILLEGNIAVGEVVTIGTHTGIVEAITLRSVFLRHGSGERQTIPFSEVANIINQSRDYKVVGLDIAVPHGVALPEVYKAIRQAGEAFKQDPLYGSDLIDAVRIGGISKFTETALYVNVYFKSLPDPWNKLGKQFQVYLKKSFDEAGVTFPEFSPLTFRPSSN